jgi:hypothetical protein
MTGSAFYQQVDESRFESSPLTAGPWGPDSQHAGPPSALLVRAMEKHAPAPDSRLARVSVDVLGPVPVAPLDVDVRVIRPGRSVELLEATASVDGRPALVARGWLMRRTPEDFPTVGDHAGPDPALRPPERGELLPGAHGDGYLSVVDFHFVSGDGAAMGPAVAWGRSTVDLVAGETMTGWQHLVTVVDSASGISMASHPLEHPAINCDLVVSLLRDPEPGWVYLDSETVGGPGAGVLTDTLLADERGRLGRCVQNLYGRAV